MKQTLWDKYINLTCHNLRSNIKRKSKGIKMNENGVGNNIVYKKQRMDSQ